MKVGTSRAELAGKDKAAMISAQTMALGIDLLVIGYKQKGAKMLDTVEDLIENSKCTCVAVQQNGQKCRLPFEHQNP